MELYIYEDYKQLYPELKGSSLTDRLIEESLKEYGAEITGIRRTEKGKPYTNDESVHFSVSHSGNIFACLIGEHPLGIDIQHERKVKSKDIARRFFTDEETEYIEKKGTVGFFALWTRKEAYSKLTGLGMEEIMRKTPVLERDDVEFIDFRLEDGLYCSCCIALETFMR